MDRRQQILEELLILEAGRGDREAFQQLVERWQERLWRYARSLTGEDDAAWDVLQEVWIAVTGNLGRLRNPASFRCWVTIV